ncbi:hypothetical protein CHELA17_61299 [Chelatococcus asaccharovorans]|nr:hypothetical protein CHELA17_61299 [Chelatococcus asaccharovorans]
MRNGRRAEARYLFTRKTLTQQIAGGAAACLLTTFAHGGGHRGHALIAPYSIMKTGIGREHLGLQSGRHRVATRPENTHIVYFGNQKTRIVYFARSINRNPVYGGKRESV